MTNLEHIIKRVEKARAQIQEDMRIAEIGGPVNQDTYNWLRGQNRAFGHVLLWLREEHLLEEIFKDDSEQT